MCDALCHGHCGLRVQDFSDVQEQIEVCEASVERLSLILCQVPFELSMLGWWSPIVGREIPYFQVTVVFLLIGSTSSQLNNEE
jgi:hypothetical protein